MGELKRILLGWLIIAAIVAVFFSIVVFPMVAVTAMVIAILVVGSAVAYGIGSSILDKKEYEHDR